ncbi:MAG: DNA-processing protein DprA [Patescibacteria group bacterium]|nr:DNA-processing protein DprA [Patescibacteria group bacterium]MDD5715723.1 DNA-processing protein DprA [Patescibacteria group bacterium]
MEKQENKDTDTPYWVAFSRISGIGAKKTIMLASYFGSLQRAWHAEARELRKAGLGENGAYALAQQRLDIDPCGVADELTQMGIQCCTFHHPAYPPQLKEIYSPPAVLYVKGSLPERSCVLLAVVGTRKTSTYGRSITPRIVYDLASSGMTIVSGLALGIDALAHQSAIDAGGRTLAVLGCGLDAMYPRSNAALAEKIIETGGALLSEYPPGTLPLKQNFPARNRIISGLSRGVLVIEGGDDSGSLITAQFALDQNRDVFAVPGNVSNETSRGPNKLIKMGATVVTCADDVIQAFEISLPPTAGMPKKAFEPANDVEAAIVKHLSADPVHIDEIIEACKLETSIVNATLAILEMKGVVRHAGSMHYALTHT